MRSSKTQIAGWILSALMALMLLGASAPPKLSPSPEASGMFEKLGFTADVMFKIGVLEAFITVLFLVPRTSFLGAILLTGYLGGATVTHVRVGDSFAPPVIVGVIIWVALGLRNPQIFSLALGKSVSSEAAA